MPLPYNTFSGSLYSGAYNFNNFCDRRGLFAVLNLPVNCLSGSWYCDQNIGYAFKVYQMNVLKKKSMII